MEDGELEGSGEGIGELGKDHKIYVGMEFDSEDSAYNFYNEHGRIVGFSIRKSHSTKSKIDGIQIARKLVCCKEGVKEKDKRYLVVEKPHAETRTNCGAFMSISLNRNLSKWVVTKFDDNHNHPLHLCDCTHMMPSQRKVNEALKVTIDIGADIGMTLKDSHDFLSALAGGKEHVGFSREDQKGYLRKRRSKDMEYGEAGILLRHFQQKVAENPYFTHKVQLDVEEKITNIFWADHQMIQDYGLFGDAVSFDTTFQTNSEFRPLALFCGFNHFRMTVVFGAALLYDETAESFEWLFETFLHVMSGKKPSCFFTDQDAAMSKALSQVMPDVFHGLCTFHIMQNALTHLGYLFKNGSMFGKDLEHVIYGLEEETELKEEWDALIAKYELQGNQWMKRTWEIRKQWAHVFMKLHFTAGMRSTQLSESINAKVKQFLKADKNIVQFFTQFDRIIEEKRYQEVEATYNSRQKLPKSKLKRTPMLNQVAKLYTPTVFQLFHNEFDISHCCQVKQLHELHGIFRCDIVMYGKGREYIVEGEVEDNESVMNRSCREIRCTCRKFESFGILCGHAIKALERMNVMKLPEMYILSRWRLNAKDCASIDEKVTIDEVDPKLVIASCYRNLCPILVNLASRSSLYEPAHKLVDDTIRQLVAEVDKMMITLDGSLDCDGNSKTTTENFENVDPNLAQAKGLKKKEGRKKGGGTGRQKSWFELKKKRKVGSQAPQHIDILSSTTSVRNSSLCSQQDVGMPYLPQMSYTQLLTSGTSVPFTPNYPHSLPLSYPPTYGLQGSHGRTFDLARQNSREVESFLRNDTSLNSLDFSGPSWPPSQN